MVLQRLVSSPATLQPVSLGRVHASSLRCILLCKEVFAALVQTGVMRPAKPAHLERFAVVVVMGIDPDAIVFRSPAHLAGLFVQLSRSECPLYGDMGRVLAWVRPSPVRLSGIALEATSGIFRGAILRGNSCR